MTPAFEAVIGLEVHAQLLTETKLFSSAPTRFGQPPNSQVSAVCLGLPGALPVLNRKAIDLAIAAGLACNCTIAETSVFARKSYFYADLPKGYQISQFDEPLCVGGGVDVPLDGGFFHAELERIHVEEDAGKSLHGEGSSQHSWIDLNRAGVPLIEIVGRPDLSTPEQAAALFEELRAILVYAGACDGNLEQGSMRCDANVSIRPVGQTTLGTRCEIKNMNSFRSVREAVTYEIARQIRAVSAGQTIVQQTRLWDADRGRTEAMRGKEEAHDYRYFPDPDLPVVRVDAGRIAAIRAALPEPPSARRAKLIAAGVSPDAAIALCQERALVDAFEAAVPADAKPEHLASFAQFVLSRATGALNQSERSSSDLRDGMPPLLETHDRWRAGKLSNKMLGDVLRAAFTSAKPLPEALKSALSDAGEAVTDEAALRPIIADVLALHEAKVASYRAGKAQLFGFFMGQVMKSLRGKGDAKAITALLRTMLDNP